MTSDPTDSAGQSRLPYGSLLRVRLSGFASRARHARQLLSSAEAAIGA